MTRKTMLALAAAGAAFLAGPTLAADDDRESATASSELAQASPMMGPHMMMGPGYGTAPGWGMGYGWQAGASPCWQPESLQPGAGFAPGMMGPTMGPMMGPGRTALVDRNQDGIVTAEEAAAWYEDAFALLDADDDEVVTSEEYAAGRTGMHGPQLTQRGQARFKAIDKNGDGKLSRDELLEFGAARFKTADRDNDGKVTVWEFRIARRS